MDRLARIPNESEFDYHKRIVKGKLEDGTLTDIDYPTLSEYIYGRTYAPDVARRMFYGSNKTLDLIEKSRVNDAISVSGDDLLNELEDKRIAFQKERQKFFDQRSAYNKIIRDQARREGLDEIINEAILCGNIPELNYSPREVIVSDKDLLVSLNDIHYGLVVDNYWNQYDSTICHKMFKKYLDNILAIAKTHSAQDCIVWANGDMISGSIHLALAVANKENVIEQVMGISELISDFLAELSKHFVNIRFVTISGNHSRIDTKERAIQGERLDDLIEWYVRARLEKFDNIFISDGTVGDVRIDNTMYTSEIRGKVYVGVHGDYDPNAANIQSLQTMVRKPVYAVLMGHKHHNKTDYVQGIKTIMAGSFVGMDDFCVEKRIYGTAQQSICVVDEGGVVCTYDVIL